MTDGYKLHSVVLGVDPGMHTGCTALQVWKRGGSFDPGLDIRTHPMIQGFGILPLEKTVFDGLHAFVDGIPQILGNTLHAARDGDGIRPVPTFIAVERFVITQKSTTEGAGNAMETIGALKTIVHQRFSHIWIDVTQKSNTKGTISNATLTALGLKARGEGLPDHAYDSARHAVKLITRFRELGVRGVAKGCWQDEFTRSV